MDLKKKKMTRFCLSSEKGLKGLKGLKGSKTLEL
jgi:hypothetical protein